MGVSFLRNFRYLHLPLCGVLMFSAFCARASELPPQWFQWLAVVEEQKGAMTDEFVTKAPEARSMDAWLATQNVFQLKAFEFEMKQRLFFDQRKNTFDPVLTHQRSLTAAALFSLSSSLRLQNLARQFLFGSPLREKLLTYADQHFLLPYFMQIFYPFSFWRRSSIWTAATAEVIFKNVDELAILPPVQAVAGESPQERVSIWKVQFLSREWFKESPDRIVPILEALVVSSPDERMENFLVEDVLSRKDLIRRSEWKYWVWSLVEPLLPYMEHSEITKDRVKKILRLLQLPGAEAHTVLIERLLRRSDKSLDDFIEQEILADPNFAGHPLLVKLNRGPKLSITRLRYAFNSGESLNLWSSSIGRFCQAHLRRTLLRGARKIGVYPLISPARP
jgi:hypothetical protein